MGNVVNLGKVRKLRSRDHARQQASENRTRFGRTKAEKQFDAMNSQKMQTVLDQHRIDDKEQS
ncbi:MAG: DUF4169 family protein [Xanthobacteraceae bacterium]|nr:MAG: DUF4169 family protein [Xanthobacteraceae bacterium]